MIRILACSALVASLSLPAEAALINGENNGKGTVIDTINQTEWLDIDETTGLSPNEALAANPGYRWATFSDMQALLDEFFAANPPAPSTYVLTNNSTDFEELTFAQGGAWVALFAFNIGDPGFTYGYLNDETDDGNQDSFHLGDGGGSAVIDSNISDLNGTPDGDLSSAFTGVYMVRNIPEPTSLALLGLGGLLVAQRRNRS